jgi:hypothetical protein
VSKCQQVLERWPSHRRQELLTAVEQQSDSGKAGSVTHYYDPLEDDPSVSRFIELARQEAESLVLSKDGRQFGHCFRVWDTMQRILHERHGIEWLTPAQLNPSIAFD